MSILQIKNALDSPNFDPVQYFNKLFPNEQSLASVDGVLSKLENKMDEMNEEAKRLTDTQFLKNTQEGNTKLDKAKEAIQELFKQIQDIKSKAAQSESMVQDITQDVKSLDYAKRHLTHSVTVLKRLQMLVTAVEQLEIMSRNMQFKESAQLLQAVIQLTQHFKTYKSVPQIARLSDRIKKLKKELENCVVRELGKGFNQEGQLVGQPWLLHDACLVANVLGDATNEKIITKYVDLQLVNYRQIFRPTDEVAQLDNISRRYAFLKRILKVCDEVHAEIFPTSWSMSGRVCERFCEYTKADLDVVLKNNPCDVKDLLKALQLTIDFESQLSKKYKRFSKEKENEEQQQKQQVLTFDKAISSAFQPYLFIYINAEDATIASMIDSYHQSDAKADAEDDGSMVVLPSSTDLFYFYRETLTQCSKFSTGKALYDLCRLFVKHLDNYCTMILLGGLKRLDKETISAKHFRFATLVLNTADYCSITTSQLEEKLKEKVDDTFREKVNLEGVKENFMRTASTSIDAMIKYLEQAVDPQMSQMTRLPWGTMDSVGDQSNYISQMLDIIRSNVNIIAQLIANKRYFRTFHDRFAEFFITKFLLQIFKCKPISEIGAEQLLLDTHSLKTLLMEIPTLGSTEGTPTTLTNSRIVNRGISKVEAILKTVMSSIEPPEGYVENYLLLVSDKHDGNFTRLLDLKGVKKTEQNPLLEMFHRRIKYHDNLSDNSNILPLEVLAPTMSGSGSSSGLLLSTTTALSSSNPAASISAAIPSSITTSLSSMASTAASNFNNATNMNASSFLKSNNSGSASSLIASPTTAFSSAAAEAARGRINENFRKLVKSGMGFRNKEIQDRKE
ncbi:Vps53-like protein [Mycotypha africana]|uniref:Vps53-like protein n=1 Tax=Mycotypha africana TaxID=64632 RepID=UPI002301995D|nr:Vps53-like protein [Mycotypha africana]KAI8983955.1 Vps53-like protein [Mycotypha africana]